ncbi:MAG TPA: phosphoribosylformylglycinamidine synthase subunit PurQ [Bacteroidales bacterium]|nr:phosphoribosylformylglycinamidine synthase subunit PurQ [Bacteroidales bacterium]HQH18398.1 phosphoribosylformylglycinamidine synthase subunit PurQ [Bacteroidales bacterium]HQI45764.1 phosphoribosylformylglycinamidine synthase subunit PurQ [Bacteroidales bacterium]
MKFGVVIFPGSNCDHDIIYTLKNVMKQEVVKLWHKDSDLQNCDFIVLPGGFSFGDYLRSGAIARFSPIMENVINFATKGGYLMGICNGFQILCEAGLLPGTLLHNNNQKFICKNIFIKSQTKNSLLTASLDQNKALKIPIAHGEGRYFAEEKVISDLQKNDQILFTYCNENAEITQEANPNGAILNIAGITNIKRNVFGMMPHPERAADIELRNTDGKLIFDSILSNIGIKVN